MARRPRKRLGCAKIQRLLPLMREMTRKSEQDSKERGFLAYRTDGQLKVLEKCKGNECQLLFKTVYPFGGNVSFHTHPGGRSYLSIADWYMFFIGGLEAVCIGSTLEKSVSCYQPSRRIEEILNLAAKARREEGRPVRMSTLVGDVEKALLAADVPGRTPGEKLFKLDPNMLRCRWRV